MLYIFFAEGFEEVEAVATLDVIRRAGIEIKSVGIGKRNITGSHAITVSCDLIEDEVEISDDCDGIILPGGMPGTENLWKSQKVIDFVDYSFENNKLLCAICAAPIILGRKNYLKGKTAVCFPGFEEELNDALISEKFVCRDGNIITAKGMGSAVNFGIEIVASIKGKDFADNLKGTLQCS